MPGRARLVVAAALLVGPLAACSDGDPGTGGPTVTAAPTSGGSSDSTGSSGSPESPTPTRGTGSPRVVATLATGLAVPWGIAFLPDGSAVVTERDSTRVLRVDPSGPSGSSGQAGEVEEIGAIGEAAPEGEGGLLGVAVSPTYASDALLFFYLTTAEDNRVVRATYDPAAGLGPTEVVLDGIPNGFIHDGGRLAFGPDGYLYVSTGETGESSLAQDRGSLGGKILRITPDGEPAPGNPDPDSPVWTLGPPQRAGPGLRRRRHGCGPRSSETRPGTS